MSQDPGGASQNERSLGTEQEHIEANVNKNVAPEEEEYASEEEEEDFELDEDDEDEEDDDFEPGDYEEIDDDEIYKKSSLPAQDPFRCKEECSVDSEDEEVEKEKFEGAEEEEEECCKKCDSDTESIGDSITVCEEADMDTDRSFKKIKFLSLCDVKDNYEFFDAAFMFIGQDEMREFITNDTFFVGEVPGDNGHFDEIVGSLRFNSKLEIISILGGVNTEGDYTFPAPIPPLCRLLSEARGPLRRLRYHAQVHHSDDIAAVFRALEGNATLTQFWFKIEWFSVSWQDFQTMFSSLSRCTALREMVLQCNHSLPLPDKAAAKAVFQGLASCRNLRYFVSCKGKQDLEDEKRLEAAFEKSDNGRQPRFVLDVSPFLRSDGGLDEMLEAIAESNMERDLVLSAITRFLTEKEMKSLIREIPRMNALTSLRLCLDMTKFNKVMQSELLHAMDQNASLEECCFVSPHGTVHIDTVFHKKVRFFQIRNFFRKKMQGLKATATGAATHHSLVPPCNLWPHILYWMDKNKENGPSLLFWALQSYSMLRESLLHVDSCRKRQRCDDDT